MSLYEVWSTDPVREVRIGVVPCEAASARDAAIAWGDLFPLGVVCVREVGSEDVHKFEIYEHRELRARPVKEEDDER